MDMKICIVAEGCYPYVVGGVSGWINSMIKSFPDVEFILLAIVANRTVRGKFAYELPSNLTEVYEVYLDDYDWGKKHREKHLARLNKKEYAVVFARSNSTWNSSRNEVNVSVKDLYSSYTSPVISFAASCCLYCSTFPYR